MRLPPSSNPLLFIFKPQSDGGGGGTHQNPANDADPTRRTGLLPYYPTQLERRTRPWLIATLGLSSAAAISWLTCKLTRSRDLTPTTIFLHATEYVALAALAGATSVWVNVKPAAHPNDIPRKTIALTLAAAWVYAPAVTLLYWERNPFMLPAIALAALSTAFGLSRLFPHPAGPAPTHPPDHPALPSLNGLPPADTPFNLAIATALCAQACLICLVADQPTLALLLCAATVFLLAWRWSALDTAALNLWLGTRPPLAHAAIAILITAYALTWGNGAEGSSGSSNTKASTTPVAAAKPTPEDHDSSGYYGIILWPPPKKTPMVDPVLSPSASESGRLAKPLLIPFDGPYWFFKSPANAPSPRAHIAHGQPTDVNIRSTNYEPLIMEAHQSLSRPIDPACCIQIDLALTNADTHPGEINVGLLLTDTTSQAAAAPTATLPARPVAPTQSQLLLGVQPISSTDVDNIPPGRPPVSETLHFTIPNRPTLTRFNRITVIFMPSRDRARIAAKVSVESFTLIPRP